MPEPVVDWESATVKVNVTVQHTATTEVQEIELPLAAFLTLRPRSKSLPAVPVEERLVRLESALAGAVTALELLHDGQTAMSAEEIVERLLYPEHFKLIEQMDGKKPHERIDIARGTAVFGP